MCPIEPWGAFSLQAHLHDRYGQLVSVYTKLLLTKISFHVKVGPRRGRGHPVSPSTLWCPDTGGQGFPFSWPMVPSLGLGATPCMFGPCCPSCWSQHGVSSLQHPQFPAGLEVTDEELEKAAGTDVNNM